MTWLLHYSGKKDKSLNHLLLMDDLALCEIYEEIKLIYSLNKIVQNYGRVICIVFDIPKSLIIYMRRETSASY